MRVHVLVKSSRISTWISLSTLCLSMNFFFEGTGEIEMISPSHCTSLSSEPISSHADHSIRNFHLTVMIIGRSTVEMEI